MMIALDEHLQPPGVLVLRGRPEAVAGWQAELAREFLPDTTVLAIADSMPGLPPPWTSRPGQSRSTAGCAGR